MVAEFISNVLLWQKWFLHPKSIICYGSKCPYYTRMQFLTNFQTTNLCLLFTWNNSLLLLLLSDPLFIILSLKSLKLRLRAMKHLQLLFIKKDFFGLKCRISCCKLYTCFFLSSRVYVPMLLWPLKNAYTKNCFFFCSVGMQFLTRISLHESNNNNSSAKKWKKINGFLSNFLFLFYFCKYFSFSSVVSFENNKFLIYFQKYRVLLVLFCLFCTNLFICTHFVLFLFCECTVFVVANSNRSVPKENTL